MKIDGPKPQTRSDVQKKAAMGLLGLAVLIALTAIGFALRNSVKEAKEAAIAKAKDVAPRDPLTGVPILIGSADDDNPDLQICLIHNVDDEAVIEDLIRANDQAGMLKLIRTRRAIFVPNRIPATFLERGPKLCRVQITDGDQRGKKVWVSPEFILREGER